MWCIFHLVFTIQAVYFTRLLVMNTENVVTNKHSLDVHLFLKYPIFVQDKIVPDEE